VFVESIGSHWILSVMPVIVSENFGTSREEEKSGAASRYFIYFFVGLIIGSLAWPIVVRYIPKRECIILGLLFQALTNYLVGTAPTFGYLCFWRFWFGFFHLVNTLGKDFLYEFADHTQRQSIFIMRSIAVLISSFFGPLFGYLVYYGTGKSLASSLAVISLIYLSAVVFFAIVFYCSPFIAHAHDFSSEETQSLNVEEGAVHAEINLVRHKQIGVWPMLKFIARKKELRNLVLGFWMVFSVYNTQMLLSVFFIETPWHSQGLGLSDKEVSYLVVAVFLPIIMIFVISNKLVPKRITMFSLFQVVIFANMLFMLLVPAMRDLTTGLTHHQRLLLIYVLVSLFLTFNPNLISPFLNLHMNNQVPRNGRTTFNSITFIGCSLCVITLFATIIPLFSRTMFDPAWVQYSPYSKYVCFIVLDFVLGLGAYLLRKPAEVKT
jgi:hypothetical protein